MIEFGIGGCIVIKNVSHKQLMALKPLGVFLWPLFNLIHLRKHFFLLLLERYVCPYKLLFTFVIILFIFYFKNLATQATTKHFLNLVVLAPEIFQEISYFSSNYRYPYLKCVKQFLSLIHFRIATKYKNSYVRLCTTVRYIQTQMQKHIFPFLNHKK